MTARADADFQLTDGTDARSLPKVLLHDHLDGGLRPATILELADEIGLVLPASDADALADWFVDSADSGSLTKYLETFAITVAVMQSAEHLHRVAREAVLDLAEDGVAYAELRWAPELHLEGGLSLDEAVAAVAAGLAEGVEIAGYGGREIRVQQLLCGMRQSARSAEIAELAVRHRAEGAGGVCGYDLAGPEHGFPPSGHRPAFDACARAFLPATCHAGEEGALDSIVSALVDARALRLGHGLRLIDDVRLDEEDEEGALAADLGPVAEWVRDRRIALEMCPSSNLQTGGVIDLAAHPIDVFHQLGFAVTVNTDNRLMSATSASRELLRLAETFDYDLDDFEVFQLNAVAAAFLPLDDRDELTDVIVAGFDKARG